ncbi:hypothetical protein NP493_57g00013 [Ridgeia piscesae]|uniref:Uncharacterized protein n=1 Tax=Ridgeia piscesae TaxID=27915 RepID=A0AAD9PAL3_RIDPI|nr:hypothetical protein NP493_57g00013 [Ridgeia piscesae]
MDALMQYDSSDSLELCESDDDDDQPVKRQTAMTRRRSDDLNLKTRTDPASEASTAACVQTLRFHEKAVKDATWSASGREILSAGYDRTARICDVEKERSSSGVELQTLDLEDPGVATSCCCHDDFVTSVKWHPVNHHLFVSGSRNVIKCWDKRNTSRPAKTFKYKEPFGQVQDMVFVRDGSEFFCCSDLVARDSADRNIMAWHFDSGVVLSNQIFQLSVYPPLDSPQPSVYPPLDSPQPSVYPPLDSPQPSVHPPLDSPQPSVYPPLDSPQPSVHPPLDSPQPSVYPPLDSPQPSVYPPLDSPQPSVYPPLDSPQPSVYPPLDSPQPSVYPPLDSPQPSVYPPLDSPQPLPP